MRPTPPRAASDGLSAAVTRPPARASARTPRPSRMSWIPPRHPAAFSSGTEQGCVGRPTQPCLAPPWTRWRRRRPASARAVPSSTRPGRRASGLSRTRTSAGRLIDALRSSRDASFPDAGPAPRRDRIRGQPCWPSCTSIEVGLMASSKLDQPISPMKRSMRPIQTNDARSLAPCSFWPEDESCEEVVRPGVGAMPTHRVSLAEGGMTGREPAGLEGWFRRFPRWSASR